MSQIIQQPLPIFYGTDLKEDAKAVPVALDWTASTQEIIDLVTLQQNARIRRIRSVFIDNRLNNGIITVAVSGTQQVISLGPGFQGYFPLLASDQAKFTISTTGNVASTVSFINVDVPYGVWEATSSPVIIANPLPVSDALLEALISAGRFAVSTKVSGTAATDRSAAIVVGGTALNLMGANASRQGLIISNIDEVNLEDVWVSFTGAAAANTIGSFSLASASGAGFPGGSIQLLGMTSAVSVVAATAGHKISAMEW